MSPYNYSDDIYNDNDFEQDLNDDELYDVAAGLGLGDSSYRPSGTSQDQYHQQQQQLQQTHQSELTEDEVLSPSDGYFTRTGPSYPSDSHHQHSTASDHRRQQVAPPHRSPPASDVQVVPPTSSHQVVPRVPNVWVADPSLEQGSSDKAREAQEERDQRYQNSQGRFAAHHSGRRAHHVPTSTGIAASSPPHEPSTSTSTITITPLSSFSLQSSHHHSPSASAATASPPPASSAFASHHRYAPSSSSLPSTAGPSRRSATVYTERSSLFSDDAPPAYTPSPTSPSSNNSSNYQTFSPNMGRPSESESHGLLAGQNFQPIPQSMGGELRPNEDGHYEYPRPAGWRERVREFDWRRRWKVGVLGAVLAFVTVGFLVNAVSGPKKEQTIIIPSNPGIGPPGTSPPKTAPLPIFDDDGTRLAYPFYDNDDSTAEWDTQQCGDKTILYNRQTFNLDFSPTRNVSLLQDVHDGEPYRGKDVHIAGQVIIRRAGTGTPAPSIVLETASNDDALQYTADWSADGNEQRLSLLTPRSFAWSDPRTSPCLSLRATIWVPPNSALGSLNVDAVHLGITLLDNLSLQLSSFTRLASTVGPIVAATDGEKDPTALMQGGPPASFALDSRYIEVKTMSAAISGAWPLYDYLGLETISGSIHAGVTPKPALEEKPLPAVLYVHSTSGTIELFEPIVAASAAFATSSSSSQGLGAPTTEALLPPRQYGVDLYSMSGAIKAQVAFGWSCKVHTTSGHVDLTLLPVLDRSQADRHGGEGERGTSYLETHTTSGTTAITVLEPLWGDITQSGGAYFNLLRASAPVPAPAAVVRRENIGARDPYDLMQGPATNDDDDLDPASALPPGVVVGGAPPPAAGTAAKHALRALNGRHSATSATLRVTYPASWEGWIDEDSMTGSLAVAGQGVTIVRQEEDFPGIKKHVLARKGEADQGGTLKMHTTSGSIGVVIGS